MLFNSLLGGSKEETAKKPFEYSTGLGFFSIIFGDFSTSLVGLQTNPVQLRHPFGIPSESINVGKFQIFCRVSWENCIMNVILLTKNCIFLLRKTFFRRKICVCLRKLDFGWYSLQVFQISGLRNYLSISWIFFRTSDL